MSVTVQRKETPHHTHEQIAGYLRDAHSLVAEAELPEELRTAAFVKVVELLAAKSIVMEQFVPPDLAGLGLRGQ